jgi:hypothetical protein
MAFSKSFFLLEQEALLAQACFCNGLTALRQANLGSQKGLYYSAFFELSIAFERMMKLTLIVDHMASNDLTPPPFQDIKRHGHKLMPLLDATKRVCAARGLNALDAFAEGSIPVQLLTFLSGFADADGRYANINSLTAHSPRTVPDPLATWGVLAKAILQNRATRAERRSADAAHEIGAAIAPFSMTLISDMDQTHPDIDRMLATSAELDTAAKHAAFELISLVAALRTVLEAVTGAARSINVSRSRDLAEIPELGEFFEFAWPDRKYVMGKRRWP